MIGWTALPHKEFHLICTNFIFCSRRYVLVV
nr:MAG TPA: hypothetical protein [Bacteriophage sp.]